MSGPVCTQKPVHDLGNMLVSMDFTGTNPGENIIVRPSGDHTMCTMRNVEAGLGRGEGGSERIREAWGEGGWS